MPEGVKRALAAVMFTDMVGYTAMMQLDEQLALVKRNRHREVLEKTHHRFQGKIIQYFGDGTLSVFDSVVEAVRCAIAIQTALQTAPQVPLRIGLHTGDIVYSETDIIGDGVNIASRLESLAVPGSILISSKVLDDIQNQVDISTQSIGIFMLKNVTKPIEVFAISNNGLVIPQLKEIAGKGELQSARKRNLPTQLTSFIGREQEVTEIISLSMQNRLITLTGPGGTGKTRLSISVAEELLAHFSDGVFFVPLAPIQEANMLAWAIAKVLEVEEIPGQTVLQSVKNYLKTKTLLLVLDNFEQIIAAASDVSELLRSCLNLKIIVSSRIVLRVAGEQEYPVQPLVLPDLDSVVDVERLKQFPSISLFIQRSKAVKPNFDLTVENAFEVAKICNRLDGLPLAIELAAARIRLFSSKALLEKLTRSLEVLRTKDSARPARHQTLRQTIGWSFELLSEEEQAFFKQLSVFTGHFSFEAVEVICQLDAFPDADIYENLEALLEKSLIRQIENENRDTQFILLETIREFSWDSLTQSGKAQELKQRHAQYYLDYVEMAAPELTKKDQLLWMDKIQGKYDNIRAAILWTLEQKESEMGLRFGAAMWRFWLVRNQVEGWQRLDHLLKLPFKENLRLHRAKILSAMGVTFNSTNNPKLAKGLLEESLTLFEDLDDKAGMAECLNHLSHSAFLTSRYSQSKVLAERALVIGQSLNLPRVISTSFNNLGWGSKSQSRLSEAHQYFSKGVDIRKNIGDIRGYSFMLTNLAWVDIRLGNYSAAQVKLEEAIKIIKEQGGEAKLLSWATAILAENLLVQKQWEGAKAILEKAILVRDENVNAFGESVALIYLIDAIVEIGDFQLLESYIKKANANISSFGSPWLEGIFGKVKARLAFKQQKLVEAERIAYVTARKVKKINDFISLAELLELLALIKFKQDQFDQSAQAFIIAMNLRKDKKLPLLLRFEDQINQLERNLKAQIGEDTFTILEKRLATSFDEVLKSFMDN